MRKGLHAFLLNGIEPLRMITTRDSPPAAAPRAVRRNRIEEQALPRYALDACTARSDGVPPASVCAGMTRSRGSLDLKRSCR
jgi:hypothetical protein